LILQVFFIAGKVTLGDPKLNLRGGFDPKTIPPGCVL
jgi:hypothetical protein